jgi:hypothetical protein
MTIFKSSFNLVTLSVKLEIVSFIDCISIIIDYDVISSITSIKSIFTILLSLISYIFLYFILF